MEVPMRTLASAFDNGQITVTWTDATSPLPVVPHYAQCANREPIQSPAGKYKGFRVWVIVQVTPTLNPLYLPVDCAGSSGELQPRWDAVQPRTKSPPLLLAVV